MIEFEKILDAVNWIEQKPYLTMNGKFHRRRAAYFIAER